MHIMTSVKNKKKGVRGPKALSELERRFAMYYMTEGTMIDAYMRAYEETRGKSRSRKSARVIASEMFARPHVQKELSRLRRTVMRRHKITVDNLLEELEEARQIAINGTDTARPSANAAVSATMGKAKLLGLDKQVIDHVSSDGSLGPRTIEIIAGKTDGTDKPTS